MYDPHMSLSAWYLHKVIQYARLAKDAASPSERCRLESERDEWLRFLAEEIGAESATLDIAITLEAQWERRSPTH
jgi:hypothetical protein